MRSFQGKRLIVQFFKLSKVKVEIYKIFIYNYSII
jgi:hypothetical protein